MKKIIPILAFISSAIIVKAEDNSRFKNTVILNEISVKNLGIETALAKETSFESTVFAIGRIEEIPSSRSVLSSRVPGRISKLNVFVGDSVKKDEELLILESRQIGDPPPTVSLKAPQSGLIVSSHVRLGEPVEPEIELMDIVDRSEMWAIAKIPENEAAKINKGTKAYISIPAFGNQTIEAELLRYGVEADRIAGTVDGIFQIKNPDLKLKPGMRAEFSIVTSLRKNVLAVPREAIQGDPTNRVLFVKDFEISNAFERIPVQIGEENERFVEIVSGVFPMDEVVTNGSYSLVYAGGSSSISLKEALDAAHGHEHNEDGSEMTEEQNDAHNHSESTGINKPLAIYAAIITLLALFQWSRQKSRKA